MKATRDHSNQSLLRVAFGVILIVAVLHFAKPVLVPIALALLLTFVLAPVVGKIQSFGPRRFYAVLMTVSLVVTVGGSLGWGLATQIRSLIAELPKHKDQIREKVERLRGSGSGPFSELVAMAQEMAGQPSTTLGDARASSPDDPPQGNQEKPVVVVQGSESQAMRLVEALVPLLQPLATLGMVAILVVFMLVNREDLRDRLLGLVGHGRISATSRAMGDAAERVGRYLLSLLAVNVSFGIAFAIGLSLIGLPYAFLWGVLAATMRFIPFLGTGLAASLPILWSVALSPGWGQPLSVLGYFVALSVTVSQVVEPLLFGRGTGVSPIALLIAASFWAWLWGPIGLLLATPMTVCLVVLGQHVPRLEFLSLLLGNTPALPPPAMLYERLFAHDGLEAEERITNYAALHGPEAAFDQMVIPSLRLMRRDRTAGAMQADGEDFAIATVRDIVARIDIPDSPSSVDPAKTILACPAHHAAEEATIDMLGRLLARDGVRVEAQTTRALPVDIVERVAETRPAAVFIAVLPPGGLPQTAFLCRILHKRYPTLKIVVGWLGRERNFDRLLVKLRKAGASYVTTSLQQCRSQLRFVADVPSPSPPIDAPQELSGAAP